jgi:hypothetical protein
LFRHLLEARAMDIVMIDLLRVAASPRGSGRWRRRSTYRSQSSVA